jgi:hypothetical protein
MFEIVVGKDTMEEEQKQNEGNKLIENLRHVINIVYKNISSRKGYFLDSTTSSSKMKGSRNSKANQNKKVEQFKLNYGYLLGKV